MQLHELKRDNPHKKKKTVGRGGTRGKTSGRGMKGQKARAGTSGRPELRDIIKRIPKRRGYGKNRARTVNDSKVAPEVVNLAKLEALFDTGAEISPTTLVEKGILRKKSGNLPVVKVLGMGDVTKKFTVVGVIISEAAAEKITKAGGKVVTK